MPRESATEIREKLLQKAAATGGPHRAREAREASEALCLLEDDEYGICTACGQTISEKRLHAKPEATRCVDCQSALELQAFA